MGRRGRRRRRGHGRCFFGSMLFFFYFFFLLLPFSLYPPLFSFAFLRLGGRRARSLGHAVKRNRCKRICFGPSSASPKEGVFSRSMRAAKEKKMQRDELAPQIEGRPEFIRRAHSPPSLSLSLARVRARVCLSASPLGDENAVLCATDATKPQCAGSPGCAGRWR